MSVIVPETLAKSSFSEYTAGGIGERERGDRGTGIEEWKGVISSSAFRFLTSPCS